MAKIILDLELVAGTDGYKLGLHLDTPLPWKVVVDALRNAATAALQHERAEHQSQRVMLATQVPPALTG